MTEKHLPILFQYNFVLLFTYYEKNYSQYPIKSIIEICPPIAVWTNWATSGRHSGPADLLQQWLESNSHRGILIKSRFKGKNQRHFPRSAPRDQISLYFRYRGATVDRVTML